MLLGNVVSILESQVVVYKQVPQSKPSPAAIGPDTHLRQGGTQDLGMCSLTVTFWFVLEYVLETPAERKILLLAY